MANAQDKNASQQEPICPVVVIEDRVVRLAAPEPPIPDCDFSTCLRDAWKKFAERTALIDHITEERCTYGELEERCSRIANGLLSLGFGPGDMAVFYCVSSMSSIVAFYGVLLAGGRVVLAKSNLSQCELRSYLEDCHPSIVFCDDDKVDQVVTAQKEISSIKKVVAFGRHAKAHPFESLSKTPLPERQAQPDSADPNTLLLILCSSGTTGKPKKVMITHRNAVAHFISAGAAPNFAQVTVNMGTTPFTHVSGIILMNSTFANGNALVIPSCPDPEVLIPAIAKQKVNFMVQFPTYLNVMLNSQLLEEYDLSSLRMITLCGSVTSPRLLTEARKKLNVHTICQGYGLTESFGAATRALGIHVASDCIGVPTFMFRLKVVDVDTKEKLGPRELGEIRIKSPCCAVGYLNNPEASAALYDEEGFLKTGDIGYYDKQGLFYFTDRIKDLIKCMEEQVPPAYLEELLLQHEAVREVAVVGVQHADYGEVARAFVVLNDGYEPTDTLRNTLLNIVADQTSFKRHLHGGLEFATNIPISPTGKPLRAALKDAHVKRLQPSVQ